MTRCSPIHKGSRRLPWAASQSLVVQACFLSWVILLLHGGCRSETTIEFPSLASLSPEQRKTARRERMELVNAETIRVHGWRRVGAVDETLGVAVPRVREVPVDGKWPMAPASVGNDGPILASHRDSVFHLFATAWVKLLNVAYAPPPDELLMLHLRSADVVTFIATAQPQWLVTPGSSLQPEVESRFLEVVEDKFQSQRNAFSIKTIDRDFISMTIKMHRPPDPSEEEEEELEQLCADFGLGKLTVNGGLVKCRIRCECLDSVGKRHALRISWLFLPGLEDWCLWDVQTWPEMRPKPGDSVQRSAKTREQLVEEGIQAIKRSVQIKQTRGTKLGPRYFDPYMIRMRGGVQPRPR